MRLYRLPALVSLVALGLPGLVGCGEDGSGGNENEVLTTVVLTFTPMGGGAASTFEFNDPDGDGGDPPMIDAISLAPGTYMVAVGFENRLEMPPEIITEEVMDESDQHFVFFTGTAVNGPASDQPGAPLAQAYADMDVNGLPIGLANTITATAGTGTLTLTLRHMPPVNDMPVKKASSPADVKTGGIGAIGGSTDVQVDFAVMVM